MDVDHGRNLYIRAAVRIWHDVCSFNLDAKFPSSLVQVPFVKVSAMWTSLRTSQTLLRAFNLCQAKTFTKTWVCWLLLTFSLSIFDSVCLRKRIFHWQCWKPDEVLSFNRRSADCGVFLSRQCKKILCFPSPCNMTTLWEHCEKMF